MTLLHENNSLSKLSKRKYAKGLFCRRIENLMVLIIMTAVGRDVIAHDTHSASRFCCDIVAISHCVQAETLATFSHQKLQGHTKTLYILRHGPTVWGPTPPGRGKGGPFGKEY